MNPGPHDIFPPNWYYTVLEIVPIQEVIGEYVALERRRHNPPLWGLCPFHNERTPSFCVTPKLQMYHCYGCGSHGNAVDFLVRRTGVSSITAVSELAALAGMQVPWWYVRKRLRRIKEGRKK